MVEGNLGEKKSDETWKERAQKEKEKLSDAVDEGARSFPQPTFLGLVEELSLRAMLALGQLRHPATGEVYLDMAAAKYTIDLIGVLEEKTKGNLEPGEKAALDEVLHNLRMIFLHVSRNPPQLEEVGEGDLPPGAIAEAPERPDKPGPKIIL